MPISAGFGRVWKLSHGYAIDTSVSGEWMLYRHFPARLNNHLEFPGRTAVAANRVLSFGDSFRYCKLDPQASLGKEDRSHLAHS